MILAAGLTPAWQQIVVVDELRSGEVNRSTEVHWCASGKVLNVGIALHALGGPCNTVALIGGETGLAVQREFLESGTPARWVVCKAPTRVCTTILDCTGRRATELVQESAKVEPADICRFVEVFGEQASRAHVVVLAGSLPRGSPSTVYADLLNHTSATSILDVRGPELLNALKHTPFLVKPNRVELERTLGRPLSDDNELLAAMRELNGRGAEWVVVTDGRHPVWVASARGVFRLYPQQTPAVNPIGCGDCMAAGIAWAVFQGHEPIDAIRLGMAAAADNLGRLFPARLERDRVLALIKRIDVIAVA